MLDREFESGMFQYRVLRDEQVIRILKTSKFGLDTEEITIEREVEDLLLRVLYAR